MSLEPFQHEPLPDPWVYIRLVEILPAAKSEHLTITIKTFDTFSAPSYTALSYTWGSRELKKSIVANGKLLYVTENCWYALGQLRLNNLWQHYWIDAICINQSDDIEKSAQVNMMGATYRNAISGAIAVGRHDRDTSHLCRELDTFHATWKASDTETHFKQLDRVAMEHLSQCLTTLAMRPYWSRLWVVQEFALPPRVMILCGNSCIEFLDILVLIDELRKDSGSKSSPQNIWEALPMDATFQLRSLIRSSEEGLASFGEVLGLVGRRGCNDPRDHVFGILSLVDWAEHPDTLTADYSLSRSQVASKALALHREEEQVPATGRLLQMLQISAGDQSMWAMWERRMLERHNLACATPSSPRIKSKSTLESIDYVFRVATTGNLHPLSDRWSCFKMGDNTASDPDLWLATNPMLLPVDTHEGDILMQISCDIPKGQFSTTFPEYLHGTTLVLRRMESHVGFYSIVGHAVFLPSAARSLKEACWSNYDLTLVQAVLFTIHFDPDDLLFWAWQRLHWAGVQRASLEECDERMDVFSAEFCHTPFSSFARAWSCPPHTNLEWVCGRRSRKTARR